VQSLCKCKAVKLVVLFDLCMGMMQIPYFVNLANHGCYLAWVLCRIIEWLGLEETLKII